MQRTTETITGSEPTVLADFKARIRVTDSGQDSVLTSYLKVARQLAEKHTRRAIVQRSVVLFMDSFCSKEGRRDEWWDGVREGVISEMRGFPRAVNLPIPPLQSVTYVKTYDDNDTASTMDAATYLVDTSDKSVPGRIILRNGSVWPTALRSANAVEISYVAGYANGSVPDMIVEAIYRLAAYLYSNRGDCGGDCADKCGASMILAPFVLMRPTDAD